MRIISQDRKCDYPYENSTLFIGSMDGRVIKVVPSTGGYKGSNIAIYSTEEKAIKAMEMLRKAWINETVEFTHGIYHRNIVFQFPQDDEIEV